MRTYSYQIKMFILVFPSSFFMSYPKIHIKSVDGSQLVSGFSDLLYFSCVFSLLRVFGCSCLRMFLNKSLSHNSIRTAWHAGQTHWKLELWPCVTFQSAVGDYLNMRVTCAAFVWRSGNFRTGFDALRCVFMALICWITPQFKHEHHHHHHHHHRIIWVFGDVYRIYRSSMKDERLRPDPVISAESQNRLLFSCARVENSRR